MMTIIWIVVAVIVVGLIIYLFRDKIFGKKEGGGPQPPMSPPPPPTTPPGGPAM